MRKECDSCKWFEKVGEEWCCCNSESDEFMQEMDAMDVCQDYEQERS